MWDLIVRFFEAIARRIAEDPLYLRDLMTALHTIFTSAKTNKENRRLQYISANLSEFSQEVTNRLSNEEQALQAILDALDSIKKRLNTDGITESSIRYVEELKNRTNSANSVFIISKIDAASFRKVDLEPLKHCLNELVKLCQKPDHLNPINPPEQQIAWIEDRENELLKLSQIIINQITSSPQSVLLSAAVPKSVSPGEQFVARFACYVQEYKREVKKELKRGVESRQIEDKITNPTWKIGTKVTVCCQAKYCEIERPKQSFDWNGKKKVVEFNVTVNLEAPLDCITIEFSVLIGKCLIETVSMELQVKKTAIFRGIQSINLSSPTTFFASYATKDRELVKQIVISIENEIKGLDFFMDCLDLRPGDEWKNQLEQEICSRDAFVLYWSKHARVSPWVDWEWRTRLRYRGKEGFTPDALDPPEEAPPPDELKDLQFYDRRRDIDKCS